MSRGLLNNNGSGDGYRGLRDYGATSSSSTTNNNYNNSIPDVNFVGFSPTEFISLGESIAQNIGSVKSNWQQLERANKIIGSAKDNQTTREKVHQMQTSTNQKIQATSKDLQRLTMVARRGDKQQKLQVEKLTSDFKNVVEMYSNSQQAIAAKMKAVLLINASQSDDVSHDNDGSTSESDAQRQKLLQQNSEFEKGIILEREQRVRQIEDDVLDVNQIMRELSVLIHQQGDNIDSVENGIDHTASNVELGASELMKAAQTQASYRRKVLILLAIAVIIGLIVTGIVVSQFKS